MEQTSADETGYEKQLKAQSEEQVCRFLLKSIAAAVEFC